MCRRRYRPGRGRRSRRTNSGCWTLVFRRIRKIYSQERDRASRAHTGPVTALLATALRRPYTMDLFCSHFGHLLFALLRALPWTVLHRYLDSHRLSASCPFCLDFLLFFKKKKFFNRFLPLVFATCTSNARSTGCASPVDCFPANLPLKFSGICREREG